MTLTFNLPTHEFFFTQNPNLKKNCVCGGEGGGGHKESKAKRNWGGGGGGGKVWWGEWGWGEVYVDGLDRRTGPNQFAPSTSSKLGA